VNENTINLPSDSPERRAAWLDDVYSVVHAELGGDPNQHGRPERHYGGARFIHAAAYPPGGKVGEMIFSIQRHDLIGHPTKQVHTLEWYAMAPPKVAADLIAAYNQLALL
jgi:hypothetical protein